MMIEPDVLLIRRALDAHADTLETQTLLPTLIPEAAPLVATDPYAFLLATCLDRGTKAEVIWTIPYYMMKELGHLDARRIYIMSPSELESLFARLPRRPRYVNDAPRTVGDITRIVVEQCDGDGFAVWRGRSADQVRRTLISVYGVGPGIASMGLLLIEKAFGVHFDDLDRARMDIKPDVHTVRVLYRLGIAEAKDTRAAIHAARRLSPDFPGAIDGALWDIGRRWCSSSEPDCLACPLNEICRRRLA